MRVIAIGTICKVDNLERLPAGWGHPVDKNSLQNQYFEHILIAKPDLDFAGYALGGGKGPERYMKKSSRRNILIGLAILLLAGAVAGGYGYYRVFYGADTGLVYTGLVEGVAVGGYDPVAYFKKGEPVAGSPDISLEYKGAIWRFSSKENRDLFRKSPDEFAPAYGGYCAWATAQGYLAKGDPTVWDIVGGKLYLNYDESIQDRWHKDVPGFIDKAEREWPRIVEEKS